MTIVSPIRSPIQSPISFGLGGGAGSFLPPVLDKLLLWATGSLINGAKLPYGVVDDDYTTPATPYSIYRTDSYKTLGDFPLKVSQSHCATFNGTSEDIEIPRVDLGDDIVFECHAIFTDSSELRQMFTQGYRDFEVKVRDTVAPHEIIVTWGLGSGLDWYQVNIATGLDLADGTARHFKVVLDRASGDCDLYIDNLLVGSESNTGVTGTVAHDTVGRLFSDGVTDWTSGSLWRVIVNDRLLPLAEGSGSIVYFTDGVQGTANGSIWGSYQDYYHYNVAYGFWTNGDGVKYPYAVSGFTEYHPAGKWNGAESKYGCVEHATIIAADALGTGPFLFDGSGDTVFRTQDEFVTHAETSDIFFFCAGRGIKHYNAVLTGDELYYALLDCGHAEAVTHNGEIVTHNSEIVYVRS